MHVAISRELYRHIEYQILVMQKQEIQQALPDYGAPVKEDLSELLNQLEWGRHLYLLDEIPKTWLPRQQTETTAAVEYSEDKRDPEKIDMTRVFHLRLTNLRSFYFHPRTTSHDPVLLIREPYLLKLPEDTPGRGTLLDRIRDERVASTIKDRWDAIETDIKKVLQASKSLNSAVKKAPGIRLYLNQGYLEKLDQGTTRTRRRTTPDIDLDVDVEAITAAGVAAKLANTI
jgi:hypothetical protein